MFIDVCFPNNDEDKYISIAQKLSTDGLCFVYKDLKCLKFNYLTYNCLLEKTSSKCDASFYQLTPNILKNKKIIYFFESDFDFNQVLIKNLKQFNKLIGVSFNFIYDKKPDKVSNLCFLIKLCRKYKLNLFLASFARSPYELKNKKHLENFGRLLGMDTKSAKNSLHSLSDFFNSATFL